MRECAAVRLPLRDRAEAGRLLAARVAEFDAAGRPLVVVALPRGGVPVGAALAQALGAPLTVLGVRKIGAPGEPELALAAIAEGDPPVQVWDPVVRAAVRVNPIWWARQLQVAQQELARRVHVYRGGQALDGLAGACVVLVDDGVATGATVRAARQALAHWHPAWVVLAVPVAPRDTWARLRPEFDAAYCLAQPAPFGAVAAYYQSFPQLSDAEVVRYLAPTSSPVRADGKP